MLYSLWFYEILLNLLKLPVPNFQLAQNGIV